LGVSDTLIGKVRRRQLWNGRPEAPNRNDVSRRAVVGTLALLGPRVSELCGLNGHDADLAAHRVRIPRDATKTDAGERIVPILPALREIAIAGFLLNQKRARAEWTGLTARVQNVAVEEHSFFDVTSDPGFRKYISGEVWLLGDIDRERLINIDRPSFNRECPDYQAIQRVMARAIVEFKSHSVQRPQRQKVSVRRVLEDHVKSLRAIEKVAICAAAQNNGRLPASENDRVLRRRHGLKEALLALDAEIVIDGDLEEHDYELSMSKDGRRVRVVLKPALLNPTVVAGSTEYQVMYAAGSANDPSVVIRNRPKAIIFNTGHPAHATGDRARKLEMSLALELAYLLDNSSASALYERMLEFLNAL
jgi:hypothetical protein